MQHIKILKQLTEIISNMSPPTVSNARTSRVGKSSTSNDTTAPRVVKTIHQIHQHRTRSNTPIPTIFEEVDDTIEHVEANDNDNIEVTYQELRVAQWNEPLIYFHHPNPKGRLNITKEEEIRLNVYQRYPTNTSNYNKDALNIIEVDNIENCQKCTNTPSRSYPRLNLPQYQRPISPIGPPTRHYLQPLLVEWDDQKIGYP